MKYDYFTMLPEKAFQPRNGRTGMTLEGGGSGGGHTTSTVTQSSIPDWLRPQTEAVLGAGMQEYFQTEFNPETGGYDITGTKPYTPYSTDPRDYVAGFSPQQENVFREAAGMQTPGGFGVGTQMTGIAGQGGFNTAQQAQIYGQSGAQYGAGAAQMGAQAAQAAEARARAAEQAAYGYGQMGVEAGQQGQRSGLLGQQLGVSGGDIYGQMGARYGAQAAGMAPEAQFYGAQAAGMAPEAQMYGRTGADIGMMGLRAESLGRDVGEEARQYARQAAGMGGMYERMATDPRSVQAYMSPYQEGVTEIAKQRAIEDAQRSQLGANLGAVRQGTYGGARQTLAQSQREAALQKQLSDLDVQGLQSAYAQALDAQRFGVSTGLQGLQGAQAGLGTALQGGQLGLSGIGQALAGQQAGLQGLGQAGQLYGQGLQGLGQAGQLYGLGMQGAGVGLQGVQQQLAGTGQGIQGAQAAMQGAGVGLSGVDRALASGQLALSGAQTGMQGMQAGMQGAGVGLEGVRGAQAGYGLTGQMGAQQASIAAAQQQADLSRLGFQGQMGDIQQQREQQIINQAIQDYAISQEMPMQRLAGYNALLRGYATPTSTVSQYQAGPNALQSIGALGTAAGGFGSLIGGGKKEGGAIKLARGGITDVDAIEGMAEDLSIPQIQQSMQNETLPKYVGMPILENKVNEAERMKMAQAMMGQQGQPQSISDALMAKADQLQGITDIVEPIEAAGGGVVAFQAGGIPSTRQEEVEQYLKDRADIMGEDEYLKALKARAEKEPSIFDRLSSAGAQVGLAGSMLRDPSQFGTYAQQAAALQGAQRKSAEERELSLLAAQKAERETKGKAFDVVEGRRQETAKAEAERKFKSEEAELTRQAQITAANIAAEKPTDMRYYANMKLKAKAGDKKAQTIVEGIDNYLKQSALGRNIVAQQGVDVREKAVGVDLYDKAVQYTDSKIGRGGSRYNEYRQLQEKDKENAKKGNPTTLAEDLENSIRDRYIEKAQGQRQAQPGAAPAGAQGKPLPPPEAVSMLKDNPSALAKQQFDDAFGPGAAARALASK